jgi:CHAD domain-containing protein
VITLQPWLERLRRALEDARGRDEVEGVHQVRVATRRLDVWLRLAKRRALRDDLAWLRRSASHVRDLDVVSTLTARGAMLVEWSSARLPGLCDALEAMPPLTEERARRGLSKLARKVREAETAIGSNGDLVALHRLRRALRRLRYGLEWLGERVDPARELQDVLGALNDLRLVRELCEREDAPEEAAAMLAELEADLARASRRARDAWQRERAEILEAAQ